MIKALITIFSFLLLGEIIHEGFKLMVPGNILGMLLIFAALKLKLIQLATVKPVSDKLLQFLPLFFIPYAVGLMQSKSLLQEHGMVILLVLMVATLSTLLVTGFVQQKLNRDDRENS